jgi:predicted RNA binding protein YcfA (HicA-like mRNA interferase family)
MPRIGPIKRKDLIVSMQKLGFTGPYPGGKHEYMARGDVRVRIPNPHQSDISKDLLVRMLKEAGISRKEWEQV